MKRLGMLLFALLILLPAMLIQAQDSPLPLAVEYQGKLYVMKTLPHSVDDLPTALTLIGDQSAQYFGASWSPDGTKLVYGGKYVWDGSQSFELAVNHLQMGQPVSWTRDGQILYAELTDPTDAINYIAHIYTLAPEAGTKPKLIIDRLPLQAGCGSGTLIPMAGQLSHEVGMANLRPLWALTDYGLVYPAQCDGGISLYRPATKENFTLANGRLIRAVLSPDELRLAGIIYDDSSLRYQIVVVDLLTLAETKLTTTEATEVVAWGKDGSLFYAAVRHTRNLLDGLSPEKSAVVLSLLNPASAPEFTQANTIYIYRRAPDGSETLLHQQDAYAVGTMVYKDNTLIYSTVANGDAWVQAMADGKLAAQEIYSTPAYAYTSTAVNYITFNADNTIAETVTLPGDLQRVAVSN